MNQIAKELVRAEALPRERAALAYFDKIKFWKTPISTCDNGKNDCVDYTQWQQAWTEMKGSAAGPLPDRARRAGRRGPPAASHRSSGAAPGCGRCFCSRRPLAWFAFIYLAALVVLFISAFWQLNPFTSQIEHIWTLGNFRTLISSSAYREIAYRTVGIAAATTVTDAILAFPARVLHEKEARASPEAEAMRALLFVMVLLPLWSSYLVRVYAWRQILDHDGILNWSLEKAGLPAANLAYSNTAVWIVFSYYWLPFMILPVYRASLRAHPGVVARSIVGLIARRSHVGDHASGRAPARAARARGGVDLHLLPDPG